MTIRAEGRCPGSLQLRESLAADETLTAVPIASELVQFGRNQLPTHIFSRQQLAPGHRLSGPAVITQPDTTTLVLPGHSATIDGLLNIVIQPDDEQEGQPR